ncbi:MAG: hypothetical protein NVSMB25_02960 [Thermoleophilaceae bacterium]
MADAQQQALELILARNLVSTISLSAFLVDEDGVLVFFNDSAGDLVGRRFEEVGRLAPEDWSSQIGPFDQFGKLIPTDQLPLTGALREGLPVNGRFRVRLGDGELTTVEVSALPLVGVEGFKGAIVVFWKAKDD